MKYLACVVADIRYMFLVGGFAESPMLQLEMRKEFSHLLKIIIPQDVALTILKGNLSQPSALYIFNYIIQYCIKTDQLLQLFNPEVPKGV